MQEENEEFVYTTTFHYNKVSPSGVPGTADWPCRYDFCQHQGRLLFCSELVVEETTCLNFPSPSFVAL